MAVVTAARGRCSRGVARMPREGSRGSGGVNGLVGAGWDVGDPGNHESAPVTPQARDRRTSGRGKEVLQATAAVWKPGGERF